MMSYTDQSIMKFGQHKGKAFVNVPASWFLWAYENMFDNGKKNSTDPLCRYITDNLDILKTQAKKEAYNAR